MRILWQSVAPWHQTGYGSETATICKILQELGHEVIISAYYGLMDGGFVKWRGIPVHPADKNWGWNNTEHYYKKFKCDIVITFQDIWTAPPSFGAAFPWYPYFPIDHKPVPPLVKELLAFARKPICYSKSAVHEMWDNSIDCYYVPHCFDLEVFKPDKTKLLHFDDGKFVVGCAAINRGLRKNLNGLLEAFATFHKNHTDSTLYLHTNPDGYNLGDLNLNMLANELGIIESVIFPNKTDYISGDFTEEWMAQMYNSLDVFLLPSRGEGFGMPIIESQGCGTPVIITDCTSMSELFGAGWLLKEHKPEWTYQSSWQFIPSEECIVAALEEAYQMKQDGTISQLAAPARQKALEYSRDNVKEMWKQVLEDIETNRSNPLNREGVQQPRLLLIPKVIEPKKVLDIGCGLTTPYKPYLEVLGEYIGLDIKCGSIKADACNLPFEDKSFGFVWMSEVLEHIADYNKAVAEAKRVGVHGAITFCTPANGNFALDPEHKEVKIECPIDAFGNGMIVW